MRKSTYVFMISVLLLTACGKDSINIGKETVSEEVMQETSAEDETEESAEETVENPEPFEETEKIKEIPMNVELSAEYEGEWDENGAIITANSASVHILDDGYETLKNVLTEYNEKNWQEVYAMYLENREFAKEEELPGNEKMFISREIEVTRADSRILSFINKETSYFGGAHSNVSSCAEVFDSVTGEKLELSDVVNDYDRVYAYVLDALKEEYDSDLFFEDYEDTIFRLFYPENEADEGTLEWNMDMKGISFTFSPYVIGPWASGTFSVSLPAEEEADLLKDEYRSTTEYPIFRVKENAIFKIDTDSSENEECYRINPEKDDETNTTRFQIQAYPDAENLDEAQMKTQDFEFYGDFKYAYVVTGENGKKYLYAEFLSENDWHRMEVIDLKAVLKEEDAYVGSTGCATYGHMISDSEQFTLYERIYVLGTYAGYKSYSVGKDGMPVTKNVMYNLINQVADRETTLTTKKNLKVQLHMSGSDETIETVIRKGTILYPKRTDGDTVMEFETEDGRVCDLLLEKAENGSFMIQGIPEEECFEVLPYAG